MFLDLLIALKLPLIALQIVLCPIMVALVLLQSGKGDDLASAFSGMGGGQSSLGTGGTSKFLVRGTVILAVLFMVNSITLAKIFKATATASVGTSQPEPMAPATDPNKKPTEEMPAGVPAEQAPAAKPNEPAGKAPAANPTEPSKEGAATQAPVAPAKPPAKAPESQPAKPAQ